jgi:hypothetical protein
MAAMPAPTIAMCWGEFIGVLQKFKVYWLYTLCSMPLLGIWRLCWLRSIGYGVGLQATAVEQGRTCDGIFKLV